MREATREDFRDTQSLGVAGFPTLALRDDGQLFLVASGFTPADEIERRVAEIARRRAQRTEGEA
jgi:protein-disulfide isomerase-like protein with CxxC motif